MEYTVRLHPDYAEAVTRGEVNLADGKACVDEVLLLCREHHLSKVLVNGLGLSDAVSISSRFVVGDYLAAKAPPGVHVSILTSTKLVRESKTLQDTANNRGALVITTDSMEEALRFLGVTPE